MEIASSLRALSFAVLSVLPIILNAQIRPPLASMTIRVKAPSNTPATDTLWIWPSLFFPSDYGAHVPMNRVPGTTDTWQATLTGPAGTIMPYQFVRNDSPGKNEAYAPLGAANNQMFRQVLLSNGGLASEVVAQWTDLPLPADVSSGTITGAVTDPAGQPLPGIWVSAGPHQTLTDAEGRFLVHGVPAGPCTITITSENGEFVAKNIVSAVSPGSTTVQDISLTPAAISTVTFHVTVPPGTPSFAVPRLYGDTLRLGKLQIPGGPTAPDTTRMLDMAPAGPNAFSYSVELGNGSCFNYLYTLGSYRLNVARDAQGRRQTHALCLQGNVTVSDSVTAWKTPTEVPVTLTVTSPTADEPLYVATDDYGGRAPVKMWPTGPRQATYTIYANPSSTLQYRYVRNSQIGEIVGTDSNPPQYRLIAVGANGASMADMVASWRHQMHETPQDTVTSAISKPIIRSTPFQTGVNLVDYWKFPWLPLVDSTMARLKSIHTQWVGFTAWFTFLRPTPLDITSFQTITTDPPKTEILYNQSVNAYEPQDLSANIRAAKAAGLHVALRTGASPQVYPGPHSEAWYDQFFQQWETSAVYYAKVAQQEGVEMLVLARTGFNELGSDGASARRYINEKWKHVIAAVRASGFTGKLASDQSLNFPESGYLLDSGDPNM